MFVLVPDINIILFNILYQSIGFVEKDTVNLFIWFYGVFI